MRKNNDLGKYVSDKLQNLDLSPKEEIWDKIEVELEKKKQKRLVYYCFLFLLVGITIGFFLSNLEVLATEKKASTLKKNIENTLDKPHNNVTNYKNSNTDTISKNSTQKISTSQSVLSETESYVIYEEVNIYKTKKEKSTISALKSNLKNSIITKKTTVNYNESFESIHEKQKNATISKLKSRVTNSNKKSTSTKTHSNSDKDNFESSNSITNNTSIPYNPHNEDFKNKSISISKVDESSTIDSIPLVLEIEKRKVEKKIQEKTKKDSIKKESREQYVTAFFGPTSYSSLSKGSSINGSMKEYKRVMDINITYGVFYRSMFKNVGFRIGIAKTNLSYSTNIPNNNNQFITDYRNIALKENITRQNINATFSGNNEIKLRQNLSYYEVPLEIYKSLSKKESDFGFAVFLGITPQFLDKNNLALESSTIDNFEIGKASNVKNVNLGFQVGFGVNYKLTENLQLDVNPVFKLQSLPYKDYHNFTPYYIAIQSGLSYKF